MKHSTLVIHPDRFEDMAQSIVNSLCNRGLVRPTNEDYDRAVGTVVQQLEHQLHLHRTWAEEDEGTHRFMADQPDTRAPR